MIRARVGLLSGVAVLALLWSAQTLIGHVVRLANEPVVQAIRKESKPPSHRELAAAIDQYQLAMRIAPCNAALFADFSLLAAYRADAAMVTLDGAHDDAPLDAMQQVLLSRLSCSPQDGKAWLDVAMLTVLREGITPRALTAYRMSALAAPKESWLAKKRLEFALAALPVLSDKELTIARADLIVLERAHPNAMNAVMDTANVANKRALYTLFGVSPPTEDVAGY